MILPLKPGLAGVISRITPEDGAIDGKLRDDWDAICEQTAVWLQERFDEWHLKYGRTLDEKERREWLLKAIDYRQELLRLNEKPKGIGNDG